MYFNDRLYKPCKNTWKCQEVSGSQDRLHSCWIDVERNIGLHFSNWRLLSDSNGNTVKMSVVCIITLKVIMLSSRNKKNIRDKNIEYENRSLEYPVYFGRVTEELHHVRLQLIEYQYFSKQYHLDFQNNAITLQQKQV